MFSDFFDNLMYVDYINNSFSHIVLFFKCNIFNLRITMFCLIYLDQHFRLMFDIIDINLEFNAAIIDYNNIGLGDLTSTDY